MGCWQYVAGQKLYFSNVPRLNTKAYYNRVIGENSGGIYVLRFKDEDLKAGFSVERYSHNLDFIEAEGYELTKHERLVKVYTTDSGINFLKVTETKEFAYVSMLRTGFRLKNVLGTYELYRTKPFHIHNNLVVASYCNNRSKVCFWVSELDESNNRIFNWTVASSSGAVLFGGKINTLKPARDIENGSATLMDNGSVAFVFSYTKDEKKRSDPGYTEHLLISAAPGDSGILTSFGDYKYFISDFDIVADEFTGTFLSSGFFDYKEPDGAHGVVTFRFAGGVTHLAPVFAPLDRKFVAQLIGAKAEKDGKEAEHYYVRKLIPRDDGGFLIVAEFFEVTQQMETFYLNGVPQTSSKNVYNYNNIILISLDSLEQIEWRHVINKRQSSFASMAHLHSIGVYVCNDNVNILYNDNTGQSNRVMHVRMLKSGILEQRIILNSDNEYTAIIPLEGKQTGYNRFVTPVLVSRQTLLLQAIDTK